jgi:RHS repeat-associated protein
LTTAGNQTQWTGGTGLDYFGARYLSAAQGRFTSPDPEQFTSRTIENPQKWNKYAYVRNNPLTMIDPDGEADFFVFRPLATENGPRWNAIVAEAPKYGNTVTIYNGNAATADRFTNALNTEGAHVIDAGGHSVEDNQGSAVGVLLGANTGVGNPAFTTDVGPAGTPLVPVGNVQASDVAVFGCNSAQLAPQFAGTTFTGTQPSTNTVAEDVAGATYTDKLVRGGTVDQAAGAAASTMRTVTNQANANPNRVMDYKKPQVCTTEDGKTTCH